MPYDTRPSKRARTSLSEDKSSENIAFSPTSVSNIPLGNASSSGGEDEHHSGDWYGGCMPLEDNHSGGNLDEDFSFLEGLFKSLRSNELSKKASELSSKMQEHYEVNSDISTLDQLLSKINYASVLCGEIKGDILEYVDQKESVDINALYLSVLYTLFKVQPIVGGVEVELIVVAIGKLKEFGFTTGLDAKMSASIGTLVKLAIETTSDKDKKGELYVQFFSAWKLYYSQESAPPLSPTRMS